MGARSCELQAVGTLGGVEAGLFDRELEISFEIDEPASAADAGAVAVFGGEQLDVGEFAVEGVRSRVRRVGVGGGSACAERDTGAGGESGDRERGERTAAVVHQSDHGGPLMVGLATRVVVPLWGITSVTRIRGQRFSWLGRDGQNTDTRSTAASPVASVRLTPTAVTSARGTAPASRTRDVAAPRAGRKVPAGIRRPSAR